MNVRNSIGIEVCLLISNSKSLYLNHKYIEDYNIWYSKTVIHLIKDQTLCCFGDLTRTVSWTWYIRKLYLLLVDTIITIQVVQIMVKESQHLNESKRYLAVLQEKAAVRKRYYPFKTEGIVVNKLNSQSDHLGNEVVKTKQVWK